MPIYTVTGQNCVTVSFKSFEKALASILLSFERIIASHEVREVSDFKKEVVVYKENGTIAIFTVTESFLYDCVTHL